MQSHKIVHLNTKVGPSSGQWAADAATDTSTDYLSTVISCWNGVRKNRNCTHLPFSQYALFYIKIRSQKQLTKYVDMQNGHLDFIVWFWIQSTKVEVVVSTYAMATEINETLMDSWQHESFGGSEEDIRVNTPRIVNCWAVTSDNGRESQSQHSRYKLTKSLSL